MAATGGRRGLLRSASAVVVALVAVLWLLLGPGTDDDPSSGDRSSQTARGSDPGTDPVSGLPWVDAADLPGEARTTLARIEAGGPFPYARDGVRFGNREGLLPEEDPGYYREYTVRTPGEDDRGARRLVSGQAGERYWTADHYASFSRVRGAA